MYIGILQLSDLTFLLLDIEGKVILAMSYKTNASSLLQLLKSLSVKKLYFIVHPLISNGHLLQMDNWTTGKISFGMLPSDLKAINQFFTESGASEGILVNALDCYENLTRLSSYNTVRPWNEKMAFVSVYNGNLNSFALFDTLNDLMDKYGNAGNLLNESSVLDVTKIKALHPELSDAKRNELVLLGPMLNAINVTKVITLPFADDIDSVSVPAPDDTMSADGEDVDVDTFTLHANVSETPTDEDSDIEIVTEQEPDEAEEQISPKRTSRRKKANLLTLGSIILSILLGASFGTRAASGNIEALDSEATLVSEEMEEYKRSAEFYKQQIAVLSGDTEPLHTTYMGIVNIKVNGLLYSLTEQDGKLSLVYYLLDDASLDTLTSALGEKYNVVSVTQTDTLNVQNMKVSVYTITLTLT